MSCRYQTESEEDTIAFAQVIAKQLSRGDTVLLRGDLGAGKSVMARGIARALGVTETMPSPSFTILIPYLNGAVPVYHYDLYRLGSMEEFYDAGLDEYPGGDGICLIEWPQAVGLDIDQALEIDIERGDAPTSRVFRLKAAGLSFDEEKLRRWQME